MYKFYIYMAFPPLPCYFTSLTYEISEYLYSCLKKDSCYIFHCATASCPAPGCHLRLPARANTHHQVLDVFYQGMMYNAHSIFTLQISKTSGSRPSLSHCVSDILPCETDGFSNASANSRSSF